MSKKLRHLEPEDVREVIVLRERSGMEINE